MIILQFIFKLGVAFSIYGFLWAIFMAIYSWLTGITRKPGEGKGQTERYILRIVKYFLMVSVVANYVITEETPDGSKVSLVYIITGAIVMAVYLLGKLQRRALLSQFANHPMLARFSTTIDLKVERILLLFSLIYFVVCLLIPGMVNNNVVNWFTNAINNIYATPIIGWIFWIVAFVFLINILMRAASVIGSLINGEPIKMNTFGGLGSQFKGGFNQGSHPFEQFRQKQEENPEFTDYEDVTDQDDEEGEEEDDQDGDRRLNN